MLRLKLIYSTYQVQKSIYFKYHHKTTHLDFYQKCLYFFFFLLLPILLNKIY